MDSRKVLDYGDVLLRQSDVDLLKGPHWLNDQVTACMDSLHFMWACIELVHGRPPHDQSHLPRSMRQTSDLIPRYRKANAVSRF